MASSQRLFQVVPFRLVLDRCSFDIAHDHVLPVPMAIEKYVTPFIVIEGYDQSENDRVYKLFTREFGLVMAHAKSIRKLESKLRAHILPRSTALVTLVKGREVWRVVGSEGTLISNDRLYEVTKLLGRFVRGEGAHKALYDRLISFVESKTIYDSSKARILLYYIVLVELGYADARVIGVSTLKEYIEFSIDDLYTHLALSYPTVKGHVHEVLKEMQL